ncbi:hypothetical protein fh0823_25180 [Francisella halioticida]|nr:hypothetical protein fh0823_25180 [Francisella halioticida]
MMRRKDLGVSLVEVLVTIAVAWIVMVLIVQSFYQMRRQNIETVENLHTHTEAVEVDNIFRSLIDNAYISGNATYSFWKLSSLQVASQLNPLNYPIIFAQRAALTPGVTTLTPNFEADTDVLVVQTIDDPQVLSTAIVSGAISFTRPVAVAPAITAGRYMLLSSESHQNLITAANNVASGSTAINMAAINQNFPAGTTLYTDYVVRIIYVEEQADGQGNVEDNLVQLNYDGTGAPVRTVLLSGVSNLQISYNTGAGWQRVTANVPEELRLWYKQIRGLRFNYNLNGESHETVVAFGGIGDNSI